MNAFDSENQQDERLDDALQRWANESVEFEPFNVSELTFPSPKRKRTTTWQIAAALGAAAMFVFALAQTSFTVSVGGTTLRWGEAASAEFDALESTLHNAENRYAALEEQLTVHADVINAIALDNALLTESLQATAIELAQRQELESAARVYDMQHLARLVAYQPNVEE